MKVNVVVEFSCQTEKERKDFLKMLKEYPSQIIRAFSILSIYKKLHKPFLHLV